VDDAVTDKVISDNPEKGSKFILSYNDKDKKTEVKVKKPTKKKK
jgi:hypothetical protein